MWMIVVILQCVLAKIIPGISILVMNVIIIVKVSYFFNYTTSIQRYTPISWLQLKKIWKKKQKLCALMRSREPSLTAQPGSSEPSPCSSPTPAAQEGGSPRRPGMAFLEIPGSGSSASSSLGSSNNPRRSSKIIIKGIYSHIREFRLRFAKVILFSFKVCVNSPTARHQ